MLRDLFLRPSEVHVLNDVTLWELTEVLLYRRRVDFGGNDDNHIEGEGALWLSVVKV